jgi:hypothetical protein
MTNTISYDVTAQPTVDGVALSIKVHDTIDGLEETVDLGTYPNHDEAATAAQAWVRADLEHFVDLGGKRTQ